MGSLGRGKRVTLSVSCGLDLGRKKGFPRVFLSSFPPPRADFHVSLQIPGIATLSHMSITIPELLSGTCQGLWDHGEVFGAASLIRFGKGRLKDNLGMCPVAALWGWDAAGHIHG